MKILLLSDTHVTDKNSFARKDNVRKTLIGKLDFIFKYATKHKTPILQAGDLSDKSRNWFVLDILIDLFNKYPKVKMFSVIGQHDSYMRSSLEDTPTTMSLLVKTNKIKILSSQPHCFNALGKGNDVNVYGSSWKEKIPEPKGKINILVAHYPISKRSIYPGHKFLKPAEFALEHKNYDLILVGDVHRKFLVEVNGSIIVNTGPMFRKEADLYNFRHKPCFYIWDSVKCAIIKKVIIPHKPANEVLTRSHIKNKVSKKNKIESLENVVEEIKSSDVLSKPKVTELLEEIIKKRNASTKVQKIIGKAIQDEN